MRSRMRDHHLLLLTRRSVTLGAAACVIVAIIIVPQTPEHQAPPLTAYNRRMAPTVVKLYTTLSLQKLFLVFSVYIRVFYTHVGLINELFVSLECSDNDSWL